MIEFKTDTPFVLYRSTFPFQICIVIMFVTRKANSQTKLGRLNFFDRKIIQCFFCITGLGMSEVNTVSLRYT